jgi:predicted NUDIX family phosphoesterase
MGKDKTVMVVNTDALFVNSGDYFEGFRPAEEVDYWSRILSNYDFMPKGLAEHDLSCKQPIAYCLLIYPRLKKVFSYRRPEDENYTEEGLQGRWSLGLGGHIERVDEGKGDPIVSSRLREMREELWFGNIMKTKHLGYLNHDKNKVGMTHFGFLFAVETDSDIIIPKDPEIEKGWLRTPEELETMIASPDFDVEEWATSSMDPLKSYLQKL